MTTAMAAYFTAWMTVVLYLGWLGARQRRLQSAIDDLENRIARNGGVARPTSRAA